MGNTCSCSRSSNVLIKDSDFEKNKITILTPDGEKVLYLDPNDHKNVGLKPATKGYQNSPSPLNDLKFHPKLRASPSVADSPNPKDSYSVSHETSLARTPKDIMAMSSHIARTRHSFTALSNSNSNNNTNLSHVKENSILRRSLNYSKESHSSNSVSVNSKTSSPNGKGSQTSLSGKSNNSIPNSPESILDITTNIAKSPSVNSDSADDGNALLINRFSIRNFITSAINTSPLRTPRNDNSPNRTPQNSSPTHTSILNELERDSIASIYNHKIINKGDIIGADSSQVNENDDNQINIYRESLRLQSRTITNKSLGTELDNNENSNINHEEGVNISLHSSYDENNNQIMNDCVNSTLPSLPSVLSSYISPAIPQPYGSNPSPSLEPPVVTKWIRILCPKQKIKIRQQPNVTSDITGYITHEDEFEVFQKVTFGFYQFVDNRVNDF